MVLILAAITEKIVSFYKFCAITDAEENFLLFREIVDCFHANEASYNVQNVGS